MAKKVISFALHMKQPIKHRTKRQKLKALLKKIFNYMSSDAYMFAPLVYTHSYVPSSSASSGEVSCEHIKKKQKKLMENVDDFLKCDCYMYAPLVMDSVNVSSSPPTVLHTEYQMETRTEENNITTEETARGQEQNTLNRIREIGHRESYDPMRQFAVEHILLQKETVKHVVHQNGRLSSVPVKRSLPPKGLWRRSPRLKRSQPKKVSYTRKSG